MGGFWHWYTHIALFPTLFHNSSGKLESNFICSHLPEHWIIWLSPLCFIFNIVLCFSSGKFQSIRKALHEGYLSRPWSGTQATSMGYKLEAAWCFQILLVLELYPVWDQTLQFGICMYIYIYIHIHTSIIPIDMIRMGSDQNSNKSMQVWTHLAFCVVISWMTRNPILTIW